MSTQTLRTYLRARAALYDESAQTKAENGRYEAAARNKNQAVAVLDVVAELTRLVPSLLDIPTDELGAIIEQAQTEV